MNETVYLLLIKPLPEPIHIFKEIVCDPGINPKKVKKGAEGMGNQ